MDIGGFHAWRDWSNPFVTFATFIDLHGAASAISEVQHSIWRDAVEHVPDGESGLVIAHGGILECGLAGLFDSHRMRDWGWSFLNLEGARLAYLDGRWRLEQILRLPRESDA